MSVECGARSLELWSAFGAVKFDPSASHSSAPPFIQREAVSKLHTPLFTLHTLTKVIP